MLPACIFSRGGLDNHEITPDECGKQLQIRARNKEANSARLAVGVYFPIGNQSSSLWIAPRLEPAVIAVVLDLISGDSLEGNRTNERTISKTHIVMVVVRNAN